MKTALLKSCDHYSTRRSLGTIIRKEGQEDSVKYLTYAEFLTEAIAAGSGIIN
jgi:hypothetical protein